MAKKYKNYFLKFGYLTVAIILVLEAILFSRPIVAISPVINDLSAPTTKSATFAWPSYGQASFSVPDYSITQSHGQQKATPIASVAKIITALAVLKEKPLKDGEQGPTLTLGPADVGYYQTYASNDGSVVTVTDGEQISEYQALQAMLLPSANNMAESLAIWAFGSIDSFKAYANNYVKELGATSTTMDDASGFSPATVSTSSDLAKVAAAAMDDSVLSGIVSQWQADIPNKTVYNTNWLVGSHDIIGIKTGNTDQAGGCFMFAAKRTVLGKNITVVGDILNADSLNTSMQDSLKLIDSVYSNFDLITALHKGQIVGNYKPEWGSKVDAVATKDLSLIVWKGSEPSLKINLNTIKAPLPADSAVGSVSVTNLDQKISSPVVLGQQLGSPSIKWRLLRM